MMPRNARYNLAGIAEERALYNADTLGVLLGLERISVSQKLRGNINSERW